MKIHRPTIIETSVGDDFSDTAARFLYNSFKAAQRPLVVLPTGTTTAGPYRSLARDFGGDRALWQKLRYLALDEYMGLDSQDKRLFHRWIGNELLDKTGVPSEHRYIFNSLASDPVAESDRVERWIADNGPIDVAVLGLGENGHIGFNEPGSSFASVTRAVQLTPETIRSNALYWDGAENVPKAAYTLGMKTIMSAKEIVLLVNGAHKADILAKIMNSRNPAPDLPASILMTHPHVTIIADKPALIAM